MPAPLDVRPNGGGGPIDLTVDSAGNTTIYGALLVASGNISLSTLAQAPIPAPGQLQLYSTDGATLQIVGAGGAKTQMTVGRLNINDPATGVTTSGLEAIATAHAATGKRFMGLQGTGDTQDHYTMDYDGKQQWGSGTANADCALGRSAAGILSVSLGSLSVTTAGQGLAVKEGSNAKQGTATLVAGAATVANTSVTATSRIFLTSQADGGTPGFLRVSTRTAGTSFTITSSSGTDTSTVAYEIFETG